VLWKIIVLPFFSNKFHQKFARNQQIMKYLFHQGLCEEISIIIITCFYIHTTEGKFKNISKKCSTFQAMWLG
jgi:hypothetical protein